jgi:hypothetical protein
MKKIKLTVFDRIALWWRFDGKYYHREFVTGVKNLWRWFPVIWKDRDWDSHYIFEILKHKINNQAKYIGEKDRHTSAKRDTEIMRLTSRLIKLNQDEFYGSEYMDYHETNYEFVQVEGSKDLYQVEDTLISDNFDEYFKKYPRQYKRVLSGELNRFNRPVDEKDRKLIAMEIAHENQERCHKLLFKILENNIRNWWD